MSQDKFFYGGQAVLEGVMMRGRTRSYQVTVFFLRLMVKVSSLRKSPSCCLILVIR